MDGSMATTTKIIQITDLHLMEDAAATMLGARTAETAERVVNAIRESSSPPDFVIATGDLTHDGEVGSYRRLKRLMESLPCPVRCALGNHDVRRGFRAGWAGESTPGDDPLDDAFDFDGLRLILLDTSVPGESGGHLDPEQIQWLRRECDPSTRRPKLIFLHHPPVEVGSPWIDLMMLSNTDQFFDAIAPARETILGIFFGHVHQDFEGAWEGIPILGSRPTSVPFTPHTDRCIPSSEPPGYRMIEIREGRLSSRVVPVPPED